MVKKTDRGKLWDSYEEQISNLKKTGLTKEERKKKQKELLQEYRNLRNSLGLTNHGISRNKKKQRKKERKQNKLTNRQLSNKIPTFLRTYSKNAKTNPTEAENVLYFQLISSEVKFVFQKPINIEFNGSKHFYIFDFFIPSKKLAIEVDGGYHTLEEQKAKDKERDLVCSTIGIRTIRFTNEEIISNCNKLQHLIKILQ